MTSKRMESINRKTRIVQRLRAGDSYRDIAAAEGVTPNRVSRVAVTSGLRRKFRFKGQKDRDDS